MGQSKTGQGDFTLILNLLIVILSNTEKEAKRISSVLHVIYHKRTLY